MGSCFPLSYLTNYLPFFKRHGFTKLERSTLRRKEFRTGNEISFHDSGEINSLRMLRRDESTSLFFHANCTHYFTERVEHTKKTFAIAIDQDHKIVRGLQFDIPLDEIRRAWNLIVHKDMLFIFTPNSITRLLADEDNGLIRKISILQMEWQPLLARDDHIYYISTTSNIVAIDIHEMTFEAWKTDLSPDIHLVDVLEDGEILVQTDTQFQPPRLFTLDSPHDID